MCKSFSEIVIDPEGPQQASSWGEGGQYGKFACLRFVRCLSACTVGCT